MKITVIGPGRWGSLITWYLDTLHHKVTLYGMESAPQMQEFLKTRSNNLLTLPESITLSTELSSVNDAEVIIISIPSQALQGLFDELKALNIKNKIFVLCMKGIEISTGRRLSQIAKDNLDPSNKVAVWIGPGHVQEFYNGIPNCMVIDSECEEVKKLLVEEFSSSLIRFYYGTDLIGNEIGAAAKNVIGIAAGMLDGLGLSSLKGALMARGTREIARLIKAEGGNEMSAYGLCHLGDYEATVFSKYSHNRQFGESFVKKEKFESLAEGYYTVKALINMGEKDNVDLPICQTVNSILYDGKDPITALDELFSRKLTNEF
ncbi:MAG: NAD(P)H-dependent glycerol-3-phosphate dehydrogenase [Acutalibacteraceae bacterium]|nr:NAD(P)H-dependent glycerol-3-phosphate dehydrogenase [Acutalibacteraceae bacterium]